MSQINQLDQELNSMILNGQALDAFEKFYAENVVMTEPNGTRRGKDANRDYEKQFFASVKEFHGAELKSSAVSGDTSFSEWVWDVTFQDGNRVKMEQVARRRWNGDHVVHERFYYNAG